LDEELTTLSSRISTSPLFDAADDASSTTSISDSGLSSETLLAGVDATFFRENVRSNNVLLRFFPAFSGACFDPSIFARLRRKHRFVKKGLL
jgi:hypothetical protein